MYIEYVLCQTVLDQKEIESFLIAYIIMCPLIIILFYSILEDDFKGENGALKSESAIALSK